MTGIWRGYGQDRMSDFANTADLSDIDMLKCCDYVPPPPPPPPPVEPASIAVVDCHSTGTPKQSFSAASACQIKDLDPAGRLGRLCPAGTEALQSRSKPAAVTVDGPCNLNPW